MGKLICDSTTSSPVIPWKDPTAAPSSIDTIAAVNLSDEILNAAATTTTWDDVSGLEDQQKRHLQRLHAKGVLWKHPGNKISNQCQNQNQEDDSSLPPAVVFRLSHGGDVEADGNCLFTASQKAMGLTEITARDLRRRTVRRFLEDLGSETGIERANIDAAIKHMYAPDLRSGWGIHVVQEVKLLAKKVDRENLDSAIEELVNLGMQRYKIYLTCES